MCKDFKLAEVVRQEFEAPLHGELALPLRFGCEPAGMGAEDMAAAQGAVNSFCPGLYGGENIRRLPRRIALPHEELAQEICWLADCFPCMAGCGSLGAAPGNLRAMGGF